MKFINLKNLKQQMIQSLKYHFLKSDIPFNNQNPSGINLYNKDYNVVGKVTFAQAIEKFTQDEYLFKITMDF